MGVSEGGMGDLSSVAPWVWAPRDTEGVGRVLVRALRGLTASSAFVR